jgi:hypothetical protein
VVRNWPGVGPFRRLNYATVTTPEITPEERLRRRRAGISAGFIEVDGKSYGILGQTGAGMPLLHTQPVMALGEVLRQLRADPNERLTAFGAALDAKAGHPITGDWSLMSRTTSWA